MTEDKLTISSWEVFWRESSSQNVGGLPSHRLLLDTTTVTPAAPAANNTKPRAVIDHPKLIVVRIPLSELPQRRFELPSRSVSFGILIADQEMSKDFLAQSLLVCNTPWRGRLWIICSDMDDGWKQFREQHEALLPHRPSIPPRLWAPDPLVANVLLPCLQEFARQNDSKSLNVWDMGAGVGRDACFLAEELSNGLQDVDVQITAVDQRYRVPDTNETTEFWQRRGSAAASSCKCLCIDLQNDVDVTVARMEPEKVDCVFAVRYWNRQLFSTLLERGTVPILAVSHFGKPAVGAEWTFATPKERHVLERNELCELFSASAVQWEILHDEVEIEPDKGRSLIQFVARRKPS